MSLPELSVKRPVAASMIMLIIMVLGGVSFTRLGLDFFPDMQFPQVSIVTTYPGAASDEIETLITRPLEESTATVAGVRTVKSTSREGLSLIQAEINWGANLDMVAQDIRNMMDIAYDLLPDEVERPLVIKTDFDLMPVLYYGVLSTTGRDLLNLRKLIEDVVKKRLETLPGVAAVTVSGGREREILVEVDRRRLEAHNLALDDIIRVIRDQNRDIPGGHIIQGTREYVLRTLGTYRSPQEIADTIIRSDGDQSVFIRDIARVVDGHKEVRHVSKTNLEDSVIFWVTKESGANTVRVARAVRAEIARLETILPSDVEIRNVWDTSKIITDSIRQLGTTVRWGGLITVVVLFLFLWSIRSTLTLMISIPFAIITTFIAIYFAGYTLNLITLSGLALGVGLIVDNSVVVLENIFRRIESGENKLQAAFRGANEVSSAITASTLTSVVVFVPFLFATGLAGELTKPLGLTVTAALFASLLIALTLVPMLASKLLARQTTRPANHALLSALTARYQRIIGFSLRHRLAMVAATIAVFLLSIGTILTAVGREYMPRLDEIYTTCVVKLAPGSALEETRRFVDKIERAIAAQPEFRSMISITGLSDTSKFDVASGAGTAGVNESQIFFEIAPKRERTRTSIEFLESIMADLPEPVDGTCYFMQTTDYIVAGGDRPITVNLFGSDLETLRSLAENLTVLLRSTEGIVEIEQSLRMGAPELQIDVDREKASLMGITAGMVADMVDAAFLGRNVTKFREGGDEFDINVRFRPEDRLNYQHVRDITITSPLGFQVRLEDIATLRTDKGPVEIQRENQERKATVSANFIPAVIDLGGVRDLITNYYRDNPLPEGYAYAFGGAIADMDEMTQGMLLAIALIVLLVYMVMAAQFESLAQPFAIMTTVPLAFIGVALALLLTGNTLSIMSFIGIVMLVGIVVNNGIVYIDYINQLRRGGMKCHEAIVEGGAVRLRPILMTTLTTSLAIMPMAISRGEGSELFAPIAVTIFGGLLTSTFLTLVILPSTYSLIDSATAHVWTFFGRERDTDGHTILS